MQQIIYNGVDISSKVDTMQSILYDNAGGQADKIDLMFADGDKLWRTWGVAKGDEIKIVLDNYSTGTMYVDSHDQGGGVFALGAISTPITAKKRNSRIWRSVRLMRILSDVAAAHGLSLSTYNIEDHTYNSICQTNETDLAFLYRLCAREGYCVKVHDGKLIVFNESYFEGMQSTVIITPSDIEPNYRFNKSENVKSSFSVVYHTPFGERISYTATDSTMVGGTDYCVELLSNVGEAQRWAKGYLRLCNKDANTAEITMRYISDIAAGSTINAADFGAEYDGRYYVYKVRLDTINQKSILSIRKPLVGY